MLLQPYPVSLFKTKVTPTQHRVRHVRHIVRSSLQKESVNIQQTTTAKTFSPFPVSQKDNKFNPAEFTHRSYNEFTHVNSVQTMKMGQKSWD